MKTLKLQNGLNFIFEKRSISKVMSAQIWVKCGSVNENINNNGISHFIEHILFKGTKGIDEGVAKRIEEMGGELNAFTSKEHTCYFVTTPSIYYKEAIQSLKSLVFEPKMEAKDIEDEREVILEEIRRYQDIPSSVASDIYQSLQFKGHPYSMPIQGYVETVKDITVEDVVKYYARFYSPSNSTLVISGDIDEQEVLKFAEEIFGDLEENKQNIQKPDQIPLISSSLSKIEELDIRESILYFGFSIPGLFHKDIPAIDLLSNILGQSESSRLFKRLRVEKGIVTSVSVSSYTPVLGGSFSFGLSFECDSQKVKSTIQEISKELFSVISELGLSLKKEELIRAKNIILSEKVYEQRTVDGVASRLGRMMSMTDGLDFDDKYIEAIKKVTISDLVAVLGKYIIGRDFSVAAVLPKGANIKEQELVEILSSDHRSIKEVKDNTNKDQSTKDLINISFDDKDLSEKPKLFKFNSGTKLVMKHFGNTPLASMYICFPGGVSYETDKNNGISNLASRSLIYGAKGLSYDEITEKIDSTASFFDVFSGKDGFGVSLAVLKPYFSQMLELVERVILTPKFNKRYFDMEKKIVEDEIDSMQDNLSSYAHSLFLKTMYKVSNYRLDPIGTKDSIIDVDDEMVRSFYNDLFDPSNMVISFSGDFDEKTATEWSEKISQYNKNKKTLQKRSIKEPEQVSARELRASKDIKQSHIILGYPTCNILDNDLMPLKVLAGVLSGQSGRLFVELRDKQSLAYSVFPLQMFAANAGYFSVYIASEHSKVDKCISGIKTQIEKLKNDLVTKDEIVRSKNYLVGLKEIELQTSCSQALNMGIYEFYGKDHKDAFRYSDLVMGVTVNDLQRVAQKYFLDNKENLVVLTK
jgi:zinc protease